MPHFRFGGWMHAETGWSHKSACLKSATTCPVRPAAQVQIYACSRFRRNPISFVSGKFFSRSHPILAVARRHKLLPKTVWRTNSIGFRCRPHRSRKSSGIDYVADPRQGLEVQFVAGDFNQHERAIGVESPILYGGSFQITRAQLTGGTFCEVVDASLRVHALVNVVVTRKYGVNAIFNEYGFKKRAQFRVRTVSLARRIERVMEEADLPIFVSRIL